MKGYKAFNEDLTCRDMQYEIGKEYVFEGEPIPCTQGFHFCESIADCYKFYTTDDSTRICEVEATGDIIKEGFKYVTNKIKIIAEITNENIRKGNAGNNNSGYINSGDYNSGKWNSGDNNTGYSNSGDYNSGNRNSGYKNSGSLNSGNWNYGDWNSGSWNSGYRNSGDWNSGDRNSGNKNSGNRNSGSYNSGDWNSGDSNSGNKNSGNRNSGSYNSGDWNSGYRNSGVFNTEKEPTIKLFDKDSSWTYKDWVNSKARKIMEGCPSSLSDFIHNNKTIGGYIKIYTVTTEEKQKWWDNLSKKDKKEIKTLPNFDEKKFCECVGIEHI